MNPKAPRALTVREIELVHAGYIRNGVDERKSDFGLSTCHHNRQRPARQDLFCSLMSLSERRPSYADDQMV